MNETSVVCPADDCGVTNVVFYERDGYKVLEVWLDNGDNGLLCSGCNRELDKDAVYEAASLAAVGA